MKKTIIAASLAALLLTSCGAEPIIIVNDSADQTIVNENYEAPVIIEGQPGNVLFVDSCWFGEDVTFKCDEGCRVFFSAGSAFTEGAEVIFDTDLKEATLETSLPRVITGAPVKVKADAAYAVHVIELDSVTINGEEYTMEDCTAAVVDNTVVDLDPEAEYNAFAVTRWWENGEEKMLIYAISE
ncbi:MAG: hypothetical protein E7632_12080 [Ruminococcaceae bacterium]|nr:hypothetical protein [Oscillospiraceae bacterium]